MCIRDRYQRRVRGGRGGAMVHADADWRSTTPEELFGVEPAATPPSRLGRMAACFHKCWPAGPRPQYTNQELDGSLLAEADRVDLDALAFRALGASQESVQPVDGYTEFVQEEPTPHYMKLTQEEEARIRAQTEQPRICSTSAWLDPDAEPSTPSSSVDWWSQPLSPSSSEPGRELSLIHI
eukprot:TRINITY_DN9089_c0_g1_i2.p1 TRINITY_DN9089_c0_g1~~TRINITY_DN9089_c0_g1_i2.p1  ORF type:complete len:181 (+),score=43.88 TRINITY_DN9089_c0_g1_i2:106-648(+)